MSRWKILGAALVVVAATTLVLVLPGSATEKNDFVFRNMSGATITQLYVEEGHRENWGQDKLGQHVIEHGQEFVVRFRRTHCRYDFRAVWEGGSHWESPKNKKVNLCETNVLILKCNGNNCRLESR
jgi:hypothetical protein